MNILGIPTTWQQITIGLVIVFSVVYEAFVQRFLRGRNAR
jgi:ribose/xylose/arabinose/galactoside ABC-type transport system permease subunit